jgi:NAD(P)H-hydrate repair Nnr-like enzyme with NAD(P)H-hydrate dehydratase domain
LNAAAAGVFLHGKSADDIYEHAGYGYSATEVADHIPFTLKRYLQ